jgi:hypothetical protein
MGTSLGTGDTWEGGVGTPPKPDIYGGEVGGTWYILRSKFNKYNLGILKKRNFCLSPTRKGERGYKFVA